MPPFISLLPPPHTISSCDCSQLQRRLDVRAETSIFAARPCLLWAFRSSQWQLKVDFGPRLSLLRVSAAQSTALASHFDAKFRQSLLTCSRLCVTLAARLLCFGGQCAVKYPLRKAACILSRRHKLPGRLGEVAAAVTGFMRAINFPSAPSPNPNLCGCVAFDGQGNLVVIHNHRIKVLRYIDGTLLRSIGSKKTWIGHFKTPWCIAFDGCGHIIVSEILSHTVQVLCYTDGARVRTIGSFGAGVGGLLAVTSIAVDGDGNVAVFDNANARVQVFRLIDGAHIRTIGSPGTGNGQFAEGCKTSIAFDGESNLVVADCGNHRVQVLRYSDGMHVRTIGSAGTGNGQFLWPSDIAFDAAGHIVVIEKDNNRVQVLRYSDGAHVRTIGSEGSRLGQFRPPYGGIAIDSDGRIVVVDAGNHRVQIFD
jgi:DNA-binding beta-propeller fold protein YncE